MAMTETGSERRSERRSHATGVVSIAFEADSRLSFDGELLDVSAGGFRIAHTQPALERGSEVIFRHPQAHGKARVVWNRILAGQSETGFLILGN